MNRAALVALPSLLVAAAATGQMLITTDLTSSAVVTFSPFDGSLINASLFSIPPTVQVSAIEVNDEIWISEQNASRITRYDVTGNVLATIGPTFPGGALANVRGMAFVNGLIYVTMGNSLVGHAIVVFDTGGNFVSSFTTDTLATSPFAVLPFQGDILVSGFANNKDVYRFTLAGTPVGIFHDSATIGAAHGLALASDGNVWCAGFASANVCKLDAATGAVLTSFPAPSNPRGVHELGNGNVLWTNSAGAHVYDVVAQTSALVFPGACYHVNLYDGAAAASATAYGTGCDGLALAANGLPQLGNAAFSLRLDNVPAISPAALFAFGSAQVNPGIHLAGVGMAGCFGYMSLDIGLFAGGAVSSGTSGFPLPIPNNPALSGAGLASQGVCFSLLTSLGLASSNGVALVLGT